MRGYDDFSSYELGDYIPAPYAPAFNSEFQFSGGVYNPGESYTSIIDTEAGARGGKSLLIFFSGFGVSWINFRVGGLIHKLASRQVDNADFELMARWKYLTNNPEFHNGFELFGRGSSDGFNFSSMNFLSARVWREQGKGTIHNRVAGVGSYDSYNSMGLMNFGEWHWSKIKVVGNRVRAKFWDETVSEPLDWDNDTAPAPALSGSGDIGIMPVPVVPNVNTAIIVDVFAWATGDDTVPYGLGVSPNLEPTVYWAVYPASQSDPGVADIIGGIVPNAVHGSEPAPAIDGIFSGGRLFGLLPERSYKIASVWSDGINDSLPIYSNAFFTTEPTISLATALKLGDTSITPKVTLGF